MPLHFLSLGDPQAKAKLEQEQMNQFNQTLGNISNQAVQSRQQAIENAIRAKQVDQQDFIFNREYSPQVNGQLDQSLAPNIPGQTSLLGAQNGRGILDHWDQQYPHLASYGPSRADVREGLSNRKSESDISLNEAQAAKERAKALALSKTGSEFGKPPSGYRWTENGSLVPISGGPADQKAQSVQAEKDAAKKDLQDRADLVIPIIDDAINHVNGYSAGGMASTENVPFLGQMTGAKNLGATLETIKSNLGIDQLMKMKANSRTGASGFGQLSDREMKLLVSYVRNLDQSQTPDQLVKNLNDIKTHFKNFVSLSQGDNPYGGAQHIVQRNKTTGQVRESFDGGKTWQIH